MRVITSRPATRLARSGPTRICTTSWMLTRTHFTPSCGLIAARRLGAFPTAGWAGSDLAQASIDGGRRGLERVDIEVGEHDQGDEDRLVPARESDRCAVVGPRTEAQAGCGSAVQARRELARCRRHESPDSRLPRTIRLAFLGEHRPQTGPAPCPRNPRQPCPAC